MARTVKDAAYLLQAIAGVDPYDNYTLAIPNNGTLPDYVSAACNSSAFEGARIGIATNLINFFVDNTSVVEVAAFYDAVEIIRGAGATIVEANFTALNEWARSKNETIVLEADFIVNLYQYLSVLTVNPYNITDLYAERNFTQNFPLEDYPDRNTAIWDEALALGYNNTDIRAWEAFQADLYLGGEGGIIGALERNNLDAVILPTSFSSSFPAIAQSPIVTVPLGFYPANQTVQRTNRGLVDTGPNVP